ncbi:hypothetical protein Halru_0196 [Halovivax ruber XH-70]|uniref:Uncharacterized protein n=1 Tax=Halovivax ruber (strain DSM 18193 / JCM 13892 / XH-70) TaxID=797302 RepID=L0IA89_HALRX|nr:hypothetical protein [Halovivax ruber]AGB14842.1 hypothetical protein Halru_0196 [Halovivax ruber XH-70]
MVRRDRAPVDPDSDGHPSQRDAWRDRVAELLLAGERVRERVDADEHALVVTSHRVLAFHPKSADGPQFRAVDRPNAVDVRTETQESLRLLGWAFLLSAVGTLVALVGVSVDFAGLVPTVESPGPMAGTVQGTLDTLTTVLDTLGHLLVLLGLVGLLGGLAAFARYLNSRRERLVVAVSGAPDLSIPPPATPDRSVAVLTRAIEAGPDSGAVKAKPDSGLVESESPGGEHGTGPSVTTSKGGASTDAGSDQG